MNQIDISDPQKLAATVKFLRMQKGWTQAQLSKESGVPDRTLKQLEAGDGNPTQSTMSAVCKALGYSLTTNEAVKSYVMTQDDWDGIIGVGKETGKFDSHISIIASRRKNIQDALRHVIDSGMKKGYRIVVIPYIRSNDARFYNVNSLHDVCRSYVSFYKLLKDVGTSNADVDWMPMIQGALWDAIPIASQMGIRINDWISVDDGSTRIYEVRSANWNQCREQLGKYRPSSTEATAIDDLSMNFIMKTLDSIFNSIISDDYLGRDDMPFERLVTADYKEILRRNDNAGGNPIFIPFSSEISDANVFRKYAVRRIISNIIDASYELDGRPILVIDQLNSHDYNGIGNNVYFWDKRVQSVTFMDSAFDECEFTAHYNGAEDLSTVVAYNESIDKEAITNILGNVSIKEVNDAYNKLNSLDDSEPLVLKYANIN